MPKHRKSQQLHDKIAILPSTPGVFYTYYDSEGR